MMNILSLLLTLSLFLLVFSGLRQACGPLARRLIRTNLPERKKLFSARGLPCA